MHQDPRRNSIAVLRCKQTHSYDQERVRRMRTLLFVLASLLVLISAPVVTAQDEEEPDPGANAASTLPEASLFGSGWTQSEVISPDIVARYYFEMSPDVFREGAVGVYVGPNGSRAIVANLLLTDNRVAVRTSWEAAGELLSGLGGRIDEDYERARALEVMDPPIGCLEAKRMEGVEQNYRLPAGGTLCAADDDSLLLVFIFGTVNELSGVAASDALIETMIAP